MQLLYELNELIQEKHLECLLVSMQQVVAITMGSLQLLLLSLVLVSYGKSTWPPV